MLAEQNRVEMPGWRTPLASSREVPGRCGEPLLEHAVAP